MKMAEYTCMRIQPINSLKALGRICEHNTRKEGERTPFHVDKDRMDQNKMLVGTWNDDFVAMYKNEIRSSAYYDTHEVRKNAVYAFEVEIHYPGNVNDKEKLDKWTDLTKSWICDTFGKDNVKNVVLHMDEATPHIHAVAVPMYENEKGEKKLAYSQFVKGPVHLRSLQTDYAECVKDLGFVRGIKNSPAHHQELKDVHTVVHKAFSKEAPEIKKGESIEQYRTRISGEWRDMYAKAAILENNTMRNGDIRKTASRKDEIVNGLREDINALQKTIAGMQEELNTYKKKEYLINHGIEISPNENMKKLIDDLESSLIEDAERDLEQKHINIDDVLM